MTTFILPKQISWCPFPCPQIHRHYHGFAACSMLMCALVVQYTHGATSTLLALADMQPNTSPGCVLQTNLLAALLKHISWCPSPSPQIRRHCHELASYSMLTCICVAHYTHGAISNHACDAIKYIWCQVTLARSSTTILCACFRFRNPNFELHYLYTGH